MNPARGIFLMISAITVFTIMTAFIKEAGRVPAGQAVFFRSFLSIPVILIWMKMQGEFPAALKTNRLGSHAVRSLAGSVAMGLGFAGLKYLPLPEVTAIRFVTPVVMVILAAIMLGERLRMIRISAVLVGLIGVVIITAPRFSSGFANAAALGAILTLGSACMAALAQVFIKSMSGQEKATTIVFYFGVTATFLSLFTIPFGWVWPTGYEASLLIGAGLVGGIGQLLLTSSYRFADAGVLAPFTYVSMLWSLLIGYVWFAETPTWPMMAGATLIIAAGAVIVWREQQLGQGNTAERKVKAKRWQ
ncbi:DMT family transporter [Aestuariibius sp. HNIBRBA575]|uniref:DMT family transporter n=1 Tax=Aestuariibius sp. HNIBRBA575 TaxID=3233343 RepID=UPI0034A3AE0D